MPKLELEGGGRDGDSLWLAASRMQNYAHI